VKSLPHSGGGGKKHVNYISQGSTPTAKAKVNMYVVKAEDVGFLNVALIRKGGMEERRVFCFQID